MFLTNLIMFSKTVTTSDQQMTCNLTNKRVHIVHIFMSMCAILTVVMKQYKNSSSFPKED